MLVWIGILLSCSADNKSTTNTGDVIENVDVDGDGFSSDEDCDDSNSQINPNTVELCDGVDNNCDGAIDEGVQNMFYADSDADGFGNQNISIEACSATEGFVGVGTDCDDADSSTYPGADELCDGIDNNCDDIIDEGLGGTFYVDEDRDGFGSGDAIVETCQLEIGLSMIAGDCDDSDPNKSPIENELCDGIDNNCDGQIDEGVTNRYYLDADGDSFGSEENAIDACTVPEGYVSNAGDCDDTESFAHPSVFEICDGIDNDCDGQTDEQGAVDAQTFYQDYDNDGFGNSNVTTQSCSLPTGYAVQGGDCDDTDNTISPDGTEQCNGIDDDCDGETDESGSVNAPIWYIDYDSDGFGNGAYTLEQCTQPSGYVSDSSDCNDTNAQIHPNAQENCNELDDDCDGSIDEEAIGNLSTFYADFDGDGFGVADQNTQACTVPTGYAQQAGDCDDLAADVYPQADERCNEMDDDCDGAIDESDAIDALSYYADKDGDGYGDDDSEIIGCAIPFGYVENGDDCNDLLSTIAPDAVEICNSTDDNCNGIIDDPTTLPYTTYFQDSDGDGFGTNQQSTSACSVPTGYSLSDNDCDDADATMTPISGCAENCEDSLHNGGSTDGVYTIDPDGYGVGIDPFDVYCDMTTDGGGWIKLQFSNAGNDLVFCTNPNNSNNGKIRSGDQARYYQHLPNDGFDNADFLHNANSTYPNMTTQDITYYNFATGQDFSTEELDALRGMVSELSEETRMVAGSVDDSCIYSGVFHSTDGMGHEIYISDGSGNNFILLTYGTQNDDEQDSFYFYHTSLASTSTENVYMGCGTDTPITHLTPEYLLPAQIYMGWNATNGAQWGGAAYWGSELGYILIR